MQHQQHNEVAVYMPQQHVHDQSLKDHVQTCLAALTAVAADIDATSTVSVLSKCLETVCLHVKHVLEPPAALDPTISLNDTIDANNTGVFSKLLVDGSARLSISLDNLHEVCTSRSYRYHDEVVDFVGLEHPDSVLLDKEGYNELSLRVSKAVEAQFVSVDI
jgi:hypothetical protein